MKLNDVVTESLTQEAMWDTLKSKFTKQPAAEPVRQEPAVKGNIPQQHFIGQNADNRIDPQGSGNAPVAQTDKTDPIMGYEAPMNTPTTTYNVPTSTLPSAPSTMPQNMPSTPPGKAGTTKPTYNVPTGITPTNTMMPTNMQKTASAKTPATATTTAASSVTNPAVSPSWAGPSSGELPPVSNTMPQKAQDTTKPTYNVPTGGPQTNTTMPTNMQTKASSTTPAANQSAKGSDWLPPTAPLNNNPDAVEPTEKPKAANSKGGGIMKGIGNFLGGIFDPNARVANAANKTANAVRADAIKREVVDFQKQVRGFDAEDPESFQEAFLNWAKIKYPNVGYTQLQQIADTLDPTDPKSITKAVGSAYNTNFTIAGQTSPQTQHMMQIQQQARDKALFNRIQKDAEDPEALTRELASQGISGQRSMTVPSSVAKDMQSPMSVNFHGDKINLDEPEMAGLKRAIISQLNKLKQDAQEPQAQVTPTINAPTGIPQASTLPQATTTMPPGATTPTAQPASKAQPTQQDLLRGKLKRQRKQGTSMAQKTGGGFQNFKQAAQQKGLTTAESRNFSGILWRKLKEDK